VSYQERTLEAAQRRIDRLLYWMPDLLPVTDENYNVWITHSVLVGHTVDVCNGCSSEYIMRADEQEYCPACAPHV
jgi:hypothetical protein